MGKLIITASMVLAPLLSAGVAHAGPAGAPPYVPDPGSTEIITKTQYTFVDVQNYGTQLYDVHNSSGTTIGTFDVNEGHFTDIFGYTEQEYEVTSDVSGLANDPPVGSEVDLFSGYGNTAVYTNIGGIMHYQYDTPYGNFVVMMPNPGDAPDLAWLASDGAPYVTPAAAAEALPGLDLSAVDPAALTDPVGVPDFGTLIAEVFSGSLAL